MHEQSGAHICSFLRDSFKLPFLNNVALTCKLTVFALKPVSMCFSLTLSLLCYVLSAGIAIASALIDTSQQKPMDFKEKSQGLKNRKALPPAHQGTCV